MMKITFGCCAASPSDAARRVVVESMSLLNMFDPVGLPGHEKSSGPRFIMRLDPRALCYRGQRAGSAGFQSQRSVYAEGHP